MSQPHLAAVGLWIRSGNFGIFFIRMPIRPLCWPRPDVSKLPSEEVFNIFLHKLFGGLRGGGGSTTQNLSLIYWFCSSLKKKQKT